MSAQRYFGGKMRTACVLFFVFLAILLPLSGAQEARGHVVVVQPVQKEIFEGDTLDLGVVGPGQKIEIEISRSSSIYDFRNVEEVWDRLKIEDATLPAFWISEYSLRYEANPKAFVIIEKGAADGEYEFFLHTERDYGTAASQPVKFKAKVRVTRDVLGLEVVSKLVDGGVNQPAGFAIKLENKGSANDAFNLEAIAGLPGQWKYRKQVFVPHNSERIVQYEVVAGEQGDWNVQFRATSLSSRIIEDSDEGALRARSNLVQDVKAVANGVILFPYIEQAVYYLLGFFASNFLK